MKKIWLPLPTQLGLSAILIFLSAQSSARAASPILDGQEATATVQPYPQVFYIQTQSQSDQIRPTVCSGTLIHPRLILTTAHCLFEMAQEGMTTASRTHPITLTTSATNAIRDGEDRGENPIEVRAQHIQSNPAYWKSTTAEGQDGTDVGYVRLEKSVPENQVAPEPFADASTIANLQSMHVTLVGYGIDRESDAKTLSTLGVKRYAQNRIAESFLDQGWFRIEGAARNQATGDSGGPVLAMIDGQETLIGIASGEYRTQAYSNHPIYQGAFTILRHEMMCWVQKDSGVDSGLSCP